MEKDLCRFCFLLVSVVAIVEGGAVANARVSQDLIAELHSGN
jgi:hypothetical protein